MEVTEKMRLLGQRCMVELIQMCFQSKKVSASMFQYKRDIARDVQWEKIFVKNFENDSLGARKINFQQCNHFFFSRQ